MAIERITGVTKVWRTESGETLAITIDDAETTVDSVLRAVEELGLDAELLN